MNQSAQDIKDMRSDKTTQYRYASVKSKEAKDFKINGPTATITGTNENGHNIFTMYTGSNMGSKIHESRHGGQNSRGELNTYGVSDEVSAYRAEYSYEGKINFIDINKEPTKAEMIQSIQNHTNPLMNSINKIFQISPTFVNSLVDPGFKPIYPPAGIPTIIWNSN